MTKNLSAILNMRLNRRERSLMKKIMPWFFIIIYNIIVCSAASGNVVLTVGGSGQYATMQDALRDAVPPNQYEIRVAQGTYSENIIINNNKDVRLQGGWNSDFTSQNDDPSLTVIDGGEQGSVFDIQALSGNTIIFTIEGFTIRNGKAEQSFHGGGIHVEASNSGSKITLQLTNNIITGNTSSDRGGGVLVNARQSASINVTFTDNTISDNTTNNEGGGIRIASDWGGSTVGTLTRNFIVRNLVKEDIDGGGIATYAGLGGKTTLLLKNNVITQNESGFGGGLTGYAWQTDSILDITLINNIIANNRARMMGGAIFSCSGVTPPPPTTLPGGSVYWKLTNNTITGNTAGIHGDGGITLYSGSSAGDGGLISLSSRNDIIWGNTDPYGNIQIGVAVEPGKSGVSTASVLYSDVGATRIYCTGIYTSGQTINQDPKFVDPANLGFFLQNDSPAIDAADPNQNYNDCVRPPGKGTMRGDMGAYGGPKNCDWTGQVFTDVPSTYWAYNYINAIYNAGITVGCGNGNYCPEMNVTRGQMAAFIIRAKYGENFLYTTTPYFTDVPSTHTFFKYIQKLRDDGITAVSGTYGVDNEVTRGQMAAFIIRAKFGETFSYTTTPYFSDVPSTHNFFKYVQKMKDDGITAVSGTYNVGSLVTREQMAAFLARAFLGME